MRTQTPTPSEWTHEVDANWKNPGWWENGTAKEHLAMDDLFQKHISEDFQVGPWTEPTMNQEVYFVASAGGLLKRIIRGYDPSENLYFLVDPAKGTETKVSPLRIWGKPEDAIIYKLREYSKDMIHRYDNPAPVDEDSRRKDHRRMLRFMLQQLEAL